MRENPLCLCSVKVSQPTSDKPRQVVGSSCILLMGQGTWTGILFSFFKNAADQRELSVLVNYLLGDAGVFRGFFFQLKDHLVFSKCHMVKYLSSHLPCAGFGKSDSGRMDVGQSLFT